MPKFIVPSTILITRLKSKYISLFHINKSISISSYYFNDMLNTYPYEYDSDESLDYFIHVYEDDLKVSDKYRFVKFGGMEFLWNK